MTYYHVVSQKRVLATHTRSGSGASFDATFAPSRNNFVTWRVTETTSAGGAAKDSISAQRFDTLTNLWGPTFQITERNWSQIAPEIRTATLRKNRFVAVWRARAPQAGGTADGGLIGLVARVYDKDCNPEGSEFLITAETVPDGPFFDVMATYDGGFVVMWSDGTALRSAKVTSDLTVRPTWTVNTPPSPPLCLSCADNGDQLVFAWSYDSGSGVRCFVQQLDSGVSTGNFGEAISPQTLTPLELGTATAGNSQVWVTRSGGQLVPVTRGVGSTYRTYYVAISIGVGWNLVINQTGALWTSTGITALTEPPGWIYTPFSGTFLMVGASSTLDRDGNAYPGGVTRGHVLQVAWLQGTLRYRVDPPVGAGVTTTKAPSIGTSLAMATYTATAMEIAAYLDAAIPSVSDPGGVKLVGPIHTLDGHRQYSTDEMDVIPLPGHPTAQGLLFHEPDQNDPIAYVALLDGNGAIIGTQKPITFTTPSYCGVLPTYDGGFIFVERTNAGPLRVRRFDASLTEGASITISPTSDAPSFAWTYTTTTDGKFVVSYRTGVVDWDYFYETFELRDLNKLMLEIYDGTTLAMIGSPITIDQTTTPQGALVAGNRTYYIPTPAAIEGLDGGNFVFVWSLTYENAWGLTRYTIYSSTGTVVRAASEFIAARSNYAVRRLSATSDGGFLAIIYYDSARDRVIYFDSAGEVIRSYSWPGKDNLNYGVVRPLRDGSFVAVEWVFSNVMWGLSYSADGAKRGEDTVIFYKVDSGLDSAAWMMVGQLNNGRAVILCSKEFYDGSNSTYFLYSQTVEPTGNRLAGPVDIVEYDNTPTIVPETSVSYADILGLSPRGTQGGAVVYYSVTNVNTFQALNPCCELVGSPVTIAANFEVKRDGGVAGLSDGSFVVAAAFDYGSGDPDDGSGFFWRWTVDENANTVTPVQTKVKFHQAAAGDSVREARVASLTGGGFVITWINYQRSMDTSSYDGTKAIIYARFYDSSGNPTGPAVVVDNRDDSPDRLWVGPAFPYYPIGFTAKGLSNGSAVVAWDIIDWYDDNYSSTWARVYGPTGTPVTGPVQVGIGLPNKTIGAFRSPAVDVTPAGGSFTFFGETPNQGTVLPNGNVALSLYTYDGTNDRAVWYIVNPVTRQVVTQGYKVVAQGVNLLATVANGDGFRLIVQRPGSPYTIYWWDFDENGNEVGVMRSYNAPAANFSFVVDLGGGKTAILLRGNGSSVPVEFVIIGNGLEVGPVTVAGGSYIPLSLCRLDNNILVVYQKDPQFMTTGGVYADLYDLAGNLIDSDALLTTGMLRSQITEASTYNWEVNPSTFRAATAPDGSVVLGGFIYTNGTFQNGSAAPPNTNYGCFLRIPRSTNLAPTTVQLIDPAYCETNSTASSNNLGVWSMSVAQDGTIVRAVPSPTNVAYAIATFEPNFTPIGITELNVGSALYHYQVAFTSVLSSGGVAVAVENVTVDSVHYDFALLVFGKDRPPSLSTGEQLIDINALTNGFQVIWQDIGARWSGYDDYNSFLMKRNFNNAGVPTTLADEVAEIDVLEGSNTVIFSGPPWATTNRWAPHQFRPLPDGSFVTISDITDPLMRRLYLRRFDGQTFEQIGDTVLLDGTGKILGNQTQVFMQVLANGNLAVLWNTRSEGPTVQFFAVDGNPIPTCGELVPVGPKIRMFWVN